MFFFSGKCLFRHGQCGAAQTSESSSRSLGGVVLWFRAVIVQRARERAIALQSANTYETWRCQLL